MMYEPPMEPPEPNEDEYRAWQEKQAALSPVRSEPLLACPFCGCAPHCWRRTDGHGDDVWRVQCRAFDCGANVGPYRNEIDAVEAWNRRHANISMSGVESVAERKV